MRDTKTITPLISDNFVIEQYSSGSLNLQYARSDTQNGGVSNVEQLPFILGVKGPCSLRRSPYPAPDSSLTFYRSDEPYTATLGDTTMTKDT